MAIVVVFAAHLGILGNALLSGLSAHDGPPHGARDQAAEGNQDGSSQNNVGTPCQVGHEEQNVDEEAEQANQKIENAHDEQQQQEPGRVGRAVEVSDDGENEHDESNGGGDRVNNKKRRKSGSS